MQVLHNYWMQKLCSVFSRRVITKKNICTKCVAPKLFFFFWAPTLWSQFRSIMTPSRRQVSYAVNKNCPTWLPWKLASSKAVCTNNVKIKPKRRIVRNKALNWTIRNLHSRWILLTLVEYSKLTCLHGRILMISD